MTTAFWQRIECSSEDLHPRQSLKSTFSWQREALQIWYTAKAMVSSGRTSQATNKLYFERSQIALDKIFNRLVSVSLRNIMALVGRCLFYTPIRKVCATPLATFTRSTYADTHTARTCAFPSRLPTVYALGAHVVHVDDVRLLGIHADS
jgi:hypothetical protein